MRSLVSRQKQSMAQRGSHPKFCRTCGFGYSSQTHIQHRLNEQAAFNDHILHISSEDIHWFAAAIDFEGSFHLSHNGSGWQPTFSLTNTSEALVAEVKRIVGAGNISSWQKANPLSPYESERNRKPTKRFSLTANALRKILPLVRPFLIAKRKQADLLLEALDLLKERHGMVQFSGELRKNLHLKRLEAICNEIHQLNKKGNRKE